MGAAADALERAEEGTISGRHQRLSLTPTEAYYDMRSEPTFDRHHEIFGLDLDRIRLQEESIRGLVDLRIPSLDRIERSFGTQRLSSVSTFYMRRKYRV